MDSEWMGPDVPMLAASLRPPAHPDYAAAAPPPRWVLIDYEAFVADHPNASTARGFSSTGWPVEVSFWTAPPPCVSYMCVHCPGLPLPPSPTAIDNKLAMEPRIVCAHADLVLLCLAFGHSANDDYRDRNDFFVYQATGPKPSLHLLPNPAAAGCDFYDRDTGLLRLGDPRPRGRGHTLNPHAGPGPDEQEEDGGFIVAALAGCFSRGQRDYVMYLHRSGTDGWTRHHVSIRDGLVPASSYPTSNVLTVGGKAGTMAWADLCTGILFCDLLSPGAGGPSTLRYLPLPPPIKHNKTNFPKATRDIAVVQGRIKYAELKIHFRPGCMNNGAPVSDGWTAAVWSVSSANPWKEDWRPDCNFTASDVSVDDTTMHFDLLPELKDYRGRPEPTLETLHTGHPQLSLLGDDLLYLMAKVVFSDHKAWVLAIDTRNKRLRDVAEFGAERTFDISVAFMHSTISDYLPLPPATSGNPKRPGVPLLGSYYKKQFGIHGVNDMVDATPPSWGGEEEQQGYEGDNMDLDLSI